MHTYDVIKPLHFYQFLLNHLCCFQIKIQTVLQLLNKFNIYLLIKYDFNVRTQLIFRLAF